MDKKLKVLMEAFVGEIGLTYAYTRWAICLKQQGLDVVLITTNKEQEGGLKKELEEKGIKYYESKFINKKPWNLLAVYKSMREINSIVNSEHIDVFLTHGLLSHGILMPACLALKLSLARKKVFVAEMIHGWRGEAKIKKFIMRLIAKVADLFIDIWIPVSEVPKQLMISDGLKPEKLKVIHVGIDLEKFDRDKSSPKYLSKQQWLLEGLQGRVVVQVAYLYPWKGIEFYLKAVPIVLQVFPETKFLVVGDGPLRGELESLASKLGITMNVIFTGEVEGDFIPVILSHADVGVVASLHETCSQAAMEIMAADKPIVATPVGFLPEIPTANGEIGYLVPFKDPDAIAQAIIKLLANPAKCREMGINGRNLVEEKFTLTIMTNRLKGVFEAGISRKKNDE